MWKHIAVFWPVSIWNLVFWESAQLTSIDEIISRIAFGVSFEKYKLRRQFRNFWSVRRMCERRKWRRQKTRKWQRNERELKWLGTMLWNLFESTALDTLTERTESVIDAIWTTSRLFCAFLLKRKIFLPLHAHPNSSNFNFLSYMYV